MQMNSPGVRSERYAIVRRLESWLELPLFILGIAWLVLLVVELTGGLNPALEFVGTLIWIVFVIDFGLRLLFAPEKLRFLRKNLLTAVALLVPALRVLRVARVFRLLRAAQATRGLRLVRLITSFNRGMRALAATLGRRGLATLLC